MLSHSRCLRFFFFFNDTATTEIYTLSLHDALPISSSSKPKAHCASRLQPCIPCSTAWSSGARFAAAGKPAITDRKSTRLNSSHSQISYAVFCLKKKKTRKTYTLIDALQRD